MATSARSSNGLPMVGSNHSTLVGSSSASTSATNPSNDSNPRNTSTNGIPSKALQAALIKFRARLTGSQISQFRDTDYDQLCQAIVHIQREQEMKKEMRNLHRIQSFLEALHEFGKTVEVFLNAVDVLAFIWGPIKFLLLAASNHLDSFDTLLDAYEQIGEHLPLLSEYEFLFHENAHMIKALELMYTDILEFHREAIQFFNGKVWKIMFRAFWKDFGTRFNGTLKSLARHKDLIECRADIIQYRRYQEDLAEMKKKLDDLIYDERQKKVKSVKEWLATGSPWAADHERFLDVRKSYPTTGCWILKNDAIIHWLDDDIPTTSIVWMTGIPGAGKTILASVIIEECKSRKLLTSYYYCNNNDPTNSSTVSVIKGIIEQIVHQYPELISICHNKSTSSGETILKSPATAKRLLEQCCRTVPKLFIVVDGIDELEPRDRKDLLDAIVSLVSVCDADEAGKLRVLIVSQDYSDIRKALHSTTTSRVVPKIISLSAADNEDDIRVYVSDLARKIKYKHELNNDQIEYLKELITLGQARGMFLYARLVMPNLLSQPTRQQLLDEIYVKKLPEGLGEAYERIMSRIKRDTVHAEWEKAKTLLGWMVCAKRRLTWKEIQVALSLDPDNQTIEYNDRKLRRHIHDICGSLVQLSGDRVSLVHSTAKEYITRLPQYIHVPSVECDLAVLCLQYLTFRCFNNGVDLDQQTLRQLTLEGHLAFQDYAIAKWMYHVTALVESGGRLLDEGIDVPPRLEHLSVALDDFMTMYQDEDWGANRIPECIEKCQAFRGHVFYDCLVELMSHIYTFQKKGFNARHVVSIKSLAVSLMRNRDLLEKLPDELTTDELKIFRQFYDHKRRYKCERITCMYFSEGFKDAKAQKKHKNVHERPFECEVSDCLAQEYGFANNNDLEKHKRTFHPEMSDLAMIFRQPNTPTTRTSHACSICGQTFTRNFSRTNHEMSHRGERPHVCSECGKAFTRSHDMRRHQKMIHERR